MTEQLTLPLRLCSGIYSQYVTKLLSQICTPLDQAKQGDVVAIGIDFARADGQLIIQPVTDVFTLAEEGTTQFKFNQYLSLDTALRNQIADPLMLMQNHGLYSGTFEAAASILHPQPSGPTYFNVLALPWMSIITQDDYYENVFGALYQEEINQDAVNEAMLALYDSPMDTAHAAIEAVPDLSRVLEVAQINTPIPHPDDFDDFEKYGTLSLPDIGSIRPL